MTWAYGLQITLWAIRSAKNLDVLVRFYFCFAYFFSFIGQWMLPLFYVDVSHETCIHFSCHVFVNVSTTYIIVDYLIFLLLLSAYFGLSSTYARISLTQYYNTVNVFSLPWLVAYRRWFLLIFTLILLLVSLLHLVLWLNMEILNLFIIFCHFHFKLWKDIILYLSYHLFLGGSILESIFIFVPSK